MDSGLSTVAEKKAMVNKLLSEIHHQEEQIISSNTALFEEEVRNLLDGVGEGFCYAARYNSIGYPYYCSKIPGVNTIYIKTRYCGDDEKYLEVEVSSPKGRLIPKQMLGYKVEFSVVDNYYDDTIDY